MMCGGKAARTFQIPNFFLLRFVFLRVIQPRFIWTTAFLFRVHAFPEHLYLLKGLGSCVLHLAKPQSSCFPFPMTKPKPQLVLDLNPL